MPQLVEIKAKCSEPAEVQKLLLQHGAILQGRDHQVDHYYRVPNGRLKLRIGSIERSLIFYDRPNQAGPKDSLVRLCRLEATGDEVPDTLHEVLQTALGEWQCVDKQREIYWADNVKLHVDEVQGLGHFVEIEAIGEDGADRDVLEKQCREWMKWLNIQPEDLLESSYSDMLQDVQDLPG
ncbi:MAG: class IV adenylate cyclase [Bacteroidota bacterium]